MKEPLTRGYVAQVDDADYDRVVAAGPWHAKPDLGTVYARRNVRRADGKGTTQRLHRFLLGIEDPKVQVDHRNHNGLDNRRANLRVATVSENGANRRKLKGTVSRFKGVWWNKAQRKWVAGIKVHGKRIYLGCFDNETDAAVAYYRAACQHFGEFQTTSAFRK